jgi:hypothetical protein
MDNNEATNEIWPEDMVATVAEEQTEDSPTIIPVDNQPENVDKPAEEEPKQVDEQNASEGEQTTTAGTEEVQTETGPTENQEGEAPAPVEETPEEVAKPDVPSDTGEFLTRIKSVVPGIPENATIEQVIDMTVALHEYRENNRKANAEISALLMAEKSYANFTRELISGIPLPVALARNFDMEALQPKPGDEDYVKYKDAVSERKAKMAEEAQVISKLRERQVESDTTLRSFAQAEGFDEKSATDFFGSLESDLVNLQNGTITYEFLDLYKKGKRYDADIATAKETATIAARNKKIVAEKIKNVVEAEPPTLQPTGNVPEQKTDRSWVEETIDKFS